MSRPDGRPAETNGPWSEPGRALDGKPILYAEDNLDDVFFMRRALRQADVRNPLVAVHDGQQVMDYLAGLGPYRDRALHPFPCLLLLDLGLPVRTGFDVLRFVREEAGLRNLKVVIVSASAQQADIELAWELGILDYLIKPAQPLHLEKVVQERRGKWLGE